jgi:DNA-binding transcriptional LysR family regulator
LAPCHRVLVAAPSYIEKAGGAPKSIDDLQSHTLLWHSVDPWHLDGPGGKIAVQTRGPLRTNSSEVLREAILNGLGIGLRSTWDVGPDLREGKLLHILPDWHASRRVAIYAVYPSRRFLPPKVRVFIDFLSSLYGPEPYWDAGLMLDGSAIAA